MFAIISIIYVYTVKKTKLLSNKELTKEVKSKQVIIDLVIIKSQ